MINTYNLPMRTFLYKTYFEKYKKVREMGYIGKDAALVTRMEFQDFLINFMWANQTSIKDIIDNYAKLRNDKAINEKMERQYELFKCN